MKYIIYCRKSSEEDRKQFQSLETQERILTDFAISNNLDIVQVFRESKSARFSGNRPLFVEMINMIRDKHANGILVVHVDRLSRNLKEAGEITELLDKGFLNEVRTPSDSYITSSDLLKMNINYVFAENYSRELSEKVRAGNETKLAKGEYPSAAPVGYLNVQPGKGIIPDPERAFFITRIFKLYDSGKYSIGKLVKLMFEEGFRSKRNNKLYKSSIERILKNPEYYGVIKRKGVLYPGNHKPLITKELFDSVQAKFNNKPHTKVRKLFFLYRDYLVCHKCGCKLTATLKKGKYVYYYCTNTKNVCDQHKSYIKESEMELLILDLIKQFIPDPKLLELSFRRYVTDTRKQRKEKEKIGEAKKRQIKLLEKRLRNLENMYLDERISADRFDVKKRETQNELTDLKLAQKDSSKQTDEKTLELVENFKNRVVSLWELFYHAKPQEKSEILETLLWNCGILNKKVITTRYRLPYSHMRKFKQTTDIGILSGKQDCSLALQAVRCSYMMRLLRFITRMANQRLIPKLHLHTKKPT